MHRLRPAVLGLLAFAAFGAHAQIFRCTSPDGAVTYQQDPCAARDAARRIDVPATYPPVDVGERERLLEREAALDRRLEAERERESREALARAMQPPPPPAPASQPEPEVLWIVPPIPAHRHPFAHRRGMHGLRRY